MPKIYYFAIPLLAVVCISVAEAAQQDAQTAPVTKRGAKKAPTVTAETKAALSAPEAAAAPVPASADLTTPPDKSAATTTATLTAPPMFKFGGFGTLGVSHSNLDQGDFVIDSSMPKGVGRSHDWSVGNTSRITAHVTGDFTPKISGIFQVDSEYRADGTYRPEVEWLNLKYALTPNSYMRVGRIALPTFMDSENRDVGYSYAWVNPPVDLYRQLSIPSSDGIDAVYRTEIGEASNSVKAFYGSNTEKELNSVATSKDMYGVFDMLEYGQASFHFGYQRRRTSNQNLQTGVTGEWSKASDLSVGAGYDPGEWFVISEWVQHRATTRVNAMYFSGGYRVGQFTPYVLYSQNNPGTFISDSPAPSAAAIARAKKSQHTSSLGLRWDFMRNYDFKIQYDQVKLSDDSNGNLINVPTGVTLYGSKFYVFSAVVDFVF